MSIRRQSIISSVVIYLGFIVGMVNTYFFTKQEPFLPAEYGLTTIFIAIATMMTAFANMAMPTYIFKFHPYYEDRLEPKKNDMLSWALLVSLVGFILVIVAGIALKSIVIRKYGTNAPQLVSYYYWIFPLGFGLTIYTVLEAYAWGLHKSVVTNFFREVQWRLLTTVLIVLYVMHVIKDFDLFIKLFAFTYPGIALSLLIYLLVKKKIHFHFRVSIVTKRYFKKILVLCVFVYGSTIIFTLSQVFDSFVIASKLEHGLEKAGIFGLASIMTGVIQAPQRGIIGASVAHLSRAWKEKNMSLIQRVYQRSSINQLLFACGFFLLIWLNFSDGIRVLGLKEEYLAAGWIFFLLGLTKVIDMGTGVNGQIIVTSIYWRFELLSGVLLLTLMLPLTYFLTIEYGLIGPAIAALISISIFNTVRIFYLWRKFKLFPFTIHTIQTIFLAAACYFLCYFAFREMRGIAGILLRSGTFLLLYAGGSIYMKLSPDIQPVIKTIRNRLGF